MIKTTTIAKRVREVCLDGYYVANTNYRQELNQVTFAQANQGFSGLNTVAALTFHTNYYLSGLIQAFETNRLEIRDKYSFNLPSMQSESDWRSLVQQLLANAETFAKKVEEFDDAILDQIFLDEQYGTYLRNIEGVIEHSYYHLGQIVLLRKMRSLTTQ